MEEKYCAHCGKKIKAKAKFCPYCGKAQPDFQTNKLGASAKELTEKVTKGLSGLNFSGLKNSRFKAWFTKKRVAGLIAVLLVLFGVQRFISNGGLFAPKTISLSQQVKQPGSHVWYDVKGTASKDAVIKTIFVVGSGKLTAYQIQDNDVTLGRISKLSKRQTIKLAKEQDKKYFDISATEVQNWLDDKNQVGQQDDFFGDDDVIRFLKGRYNALGIKVNKQGKDFSMGGVPHFSNPRFFPPSVDIDGVPDSSGEEEHELFINTEEESNETKELFINNMAKGLIYNIKHTKYHSPDKNKVSFKDTTDASGNKVVGQRLTYQAIDYFDTNSSTNSQIYNNLNKKQKQLLFDIYYGIPEQIWAEGKAKGLDDESIDHLDDKRHLKLIQAWTAFDNSLDTKKLTKGIFGYHRWDKDVTITGTLSQQIYNQRFIGYYGGEGEVLTKAQTKHQKAVFPEPDK